MVKVSATSTHWRVIRSVAFTWCAYNGKNVAIVLQQDRGVLREPTGKLRVLTAPHIIREVSGLREGTEVSV
jgi:hypothetical protein